MLRQRKTAEYINKAENKFKAVWQTVSSQRSSDKPKKMQLKLGVDGEKTNYPNKIVFLPI